MPSAGAPDRNDAPHGAGGARRAHPAAHGGKHRLAVYPQHAAHVAAAERAAIGEQPLPRLGGQHGVHTAWLKACGEHVYQGQTKHRGGEPRLRRAAGGDGLVEEDGNIALDRAKGFGLITDAFPSVQPGHDMTALGAFLAWRMR